MRADGVQDHECGQQNLEEKRRRRGATDKGSIGATIEIANPDCQDVVIKDADRPGITKAV